MNSLLAFCTAIYLFAKETLNDSQDYTEALDHLSETASNFIIAICMPIVGTTAAVLDAVRLITRCVATLVDFCKDSQAEDDNGLGVDNSNAVQDELSRASALCN